MEGRNNGEFMEDISSNSKKIKFNFKTDPAELYGKAIYKNLSGIIKVIAYIAAIFTMLVGFGIAIFIAKKQILYIALSFGVVLFFTVIAAVEFFLIYALGHIIKQNNDIIERLQ